MEDDFENGVWRTVGGRRIFIRDGQSLENAMKESGKFNSLRRTPQQENELKESIKNTNFNDFVIMKIDMMKMVKNCL